MNTSEAASIVRSISKSLSTNPSQFHIEVNITGQQITSYGGTGLHITATGGGPGSSTIGQSVSLDGAQITIAQKKGRQAMDQQLQALVDALNSIASELESSTPNKNIINKMYNGLLNTWVPGVITSVLGTIIASIIGF